MKLRKMIYLKIARMSRGSNTPVPSIISFGTKIKGHILSGDVIHIDGNLEGNVMCEELIIGSRGHVYGQVKAKNLNIYGLLQGSAESENVIIAKGARVTGDVLYSTIAIEPGALIEGRCVKAAKEQKPQAPSRPAPQEVKAVANDKVSA